VIDVDRLDAEVGSTIEITDVLLLSQEGGAVVGAPTVADARVMAEVIEHGRDAKITVFKYKNKTRYRRKKGHRQGYTRLSIRGIGIGDIETAEKKPRRAPRKKKEDAVEATDEVTAETTVAADAATAEAPKRAPRRARKPAAKAALEPEATADAEDAASDDGGEAPAEESE
jgi:large subunit ribosomal protein L21